MTGQLAFGAPERKPVPEAIAAAVAGAEEVAGHIAEVRITPEILAAVGPSIVGTSWVRRVKRAKGSRPALFVTEFGDNGLVPDGQLTVLFEGEAALRVVDEKNNKRVWKLQRFLELMEPAPREVDGG